MRWQKLGKIFDPTQYELPNNCFQFAQAPQAVVFNKFVRIYFSTRTVDKNNGKYLSHIAFVDMRNNMCDVIRVSNKTIVPLGGLGCFDEHGIFPMNVIRHNGVLFGYTCGWSRRVSVSVETAIGLAISHDDGLTFQRIGDGPVLSASLHEPYLVGDGFVKIIGDTFHMWYIFGTKWEKYESDASPDRTYKIGHAVSKDGITWCKEEAKQIINDRLGKDECQALPTVIKINEKYHMFFCYRRSFDFRKNKDRSYRIGHAYSDDLRNWVRDDENPLIVGTPGGFDSHMQCYPHVFEHYDKVYLLYNGNEFGRYGFGLAVLDY